MRLDGCQNRFVQIGLRDFLRRTAHSSVFEIGAAFEMKICFVFLPADGANQLHGRAAVGTNELVAERAGVSRTSVWLVEKGSPSVAMGIYAQVLLALGMQDDLLLIAKDDVLGRTMQDLELTAGKRASRK